MDKDVILITRVQGLFFLTLGRMVKWVCYYCTPAASLPLTGPPASVTLAAWTAERRWAPAAGVWDPERERPQLRMHCSLSQAFTSPLVFSSPEESP